VRRAAFGHRSVALSLVLLAAGCSHSASRSGESPRTRAETRASTSAETTTSAVAFGTGGDALYGDYARPEFGLIKKKALRFHSDVWSVTFPEPGAWKGVVVIAYWGQKNPLGHAYAYEASRKGALHLLGERHRRELGGGFSCPTGQALYSWSRSPDYTLLRLRPIRDSCAVRRKILTADWSFID
jgi:hypothetical protein